VQVRRQDLGGLWRKKVLADQLATLFIVACPAAADLGRCAEIEPPFRLEARISEERLIIHHKGGRFQNDKATEPFASGPRPLGAFSVGVRTCNPAYRIHEKAVLFKGDQTLWVIIRRLKGELDHRRVGVSETLGRGK